MTLGVKLVTQLFFMQTIVVRTLTNRGLNETKVMISGDQQKVMQKAARWPCGVCGRGVDNNSIQCTSCQK